MYLLIKSDMPASEDKSIYAILDYIAQTVGDEDFFLQDNRIKEKQLAQDSSDHGEAHTADVHREVEAEKCHTSLATGTSDSPQKA